MGALIKLIILFYMLSLVFSIFIASIRFIIDVGKWHLQEKKVKITKSIERGEYNGRNELTGTGDNNRGTAVHATGDRGTGDNNGTDGADGNAAEQRTAIIF